MPSHTSAQLTVPVQVCSRRCMPCAEATLSVVLATWQRNCQGYKEAHHHCDLTVCGQCMLACPRPAAMLEQHLSTSSVHAVGDSEVESLCLDHILLAVPLHSFDLVLWNSLQESADELLVVPVIDKAQPPTQKKQQYNIRTKYSPLDAIFRQKLQFTL